MVVKYDDVINMLDQIQTDAKLHGIREVQVNSGIIHRKLGGYPSSNHRMPIVCKAMRNYMRKTDEIITSPPKGQGASLTILYHL